jgi:3-oxoacyl-[acyl-carrier protein] reductase
MELEGKTAIITGSGRGIGKAIAVKLAEMGASVVLFDRRGSADLDSALCEMLKLGFKAIAVEGDVRSPEDVKEMFGRAIEAFGGVDILVNNAGVTRDKPLAMMPLEDWDEVLGINLKGAFLCTKAAAKYMIKQRSGKIINIASVAGVMGSPGQANYSSSKAGLIGLTKTTAKELAARGICCNAVAPGLIESNMTDILPPSVKERYLGSIPLKRFGTPLEVADAVAFLASGAANYITGQVINIDGGMVM